MRKRVVIESPYRGDIEGNLHYLRRCILDSIARGEAPFASHEMYTLVLDDKDDAQRFVGIECGFIWLTVAECQVFYADRGWSEGMLSAWLVGQALGIPYSIRSLDDKPCIPPTPVTTREGRIDFV